MKTKYSIVSKILELLKNMPVSKDRDKCKKWVKNLLKDEQGISALLFNNALEQLLKNIIKKNFSRFDELKDMLNISSINQKAKLVYALGLINETNLEDIKHIYKIRCIFAHRRPKGFADDEVFGECKKLSTAKGQNVTAKNSYDIYFNAVIKNLKHLAPKSSKSNTYTVPLMSVMRLKIKLKKKPKRKTL